MRTVTLQVVSISQKRELEPVGSGEAGGFAVGETTSSAVVTVDGSEDMFLVQIPNAMYEAIALGEEGLAEGQEEGGQDK